MQILIPVSVGELIDKITILEIKQRLIDDPAKLVYIERELDLLSRALAEIKFDLSDLKAELLSVNTDLWYIEEFKRDCERRKNFDTNFTLAARNVYLKNDLRARIKQAINQRVGSDLQDQKSHSTV